MEKRALGKTGLSVSVLGFGGFHLVEITTTEASRLLNAYLDRGGNYIETAAEYGDGISETRIGRSVSKRRGEYVLATKSLGRTRQACAAEIDRSLGFLQTDHVDVGFRSTSLYGTDYRYMTAGGWFSDQLLKRNQLYGFDPTELYLDLYIPKVMQGLILRFGRWVATPDIETQFAPDNYLATHSLLFTFDTYTQTGIMATFMINKQWIVQAGIHAGTDMAPWYKGATPTGMLGVRWVSQDNNDSVYLVLNSINDAKFRHFDVDGQPAGHDNFNYLVGTWQHRFSRKIHTKFEAYIMWQRDAVVGGTTSIGPVRWFGGGGGIGKPIPGTSWTYGILNYTMFQVSPKDYFTVRNEWWRDEEGERSGFPSTYTSHTIGLSHQFNPVLIIRPEIGYYRSYNVPAFDNGTRKDMVLGGLDMIFRF